MQTERPARTWRVSLIATLLLLLSGCQRVLFESPPGAAQCDAGLQGSWVSQEPSASDHSREPDRLQVDVAADCLAQLRYTEHGKTRLLEPGRIATARVDGHDYLWLDAGWINRAFDVRSGPLDDRPAFYLYRYQRQRSELILQPMPVKALAQAVAKEKIRGDLYWRDADITVRVSGDAAATRDALRLMGRLTSSEPMQFVREVGKETGDE